MQKIRLLSLALTASLAILDADTLKKIRLEYELTVV